LIPRKIKRILIPKATSKDKIGRLKVGATNQTQKVAMKFPSKMQTINEIKGGKIKENNLFMGVL
jgi:hypothetical protein